MIIGSHNANVHARCALHSKDDALDRVHNMGVSAHHVHEAEILRQGRDAAPRASVHVAELAAPGSRPKKRRHGSEGRSQQHPSSTGIQMRDNSFPMQLERLLTDT